MTATTLPLPRLAGYGLAAPTGNEFLSALKTVDPRHAENIWAEACAQLDVPSWTRLFDVEQLIQLADLLAERSGSVGVIGRSLGVRCRAYKHLSTVDTAVNWRETDWSRTSLESLLRTRTPERARLAEIADFDVFTSGAKYKLDEVARRAANAMHAEVAVVGLFLDNVHYFAGTHGMFGWSKEANGNPIEWSFCAKIAWSGEAQSFIDFREDVLQRTNPLVLDSPARSYAGVPLKSSKGVIVGSVCVIGVNPHSYDEADLENLQIIADSAVSYLESVRFSNK
jgi:hypothetical protein